MLENDDSIILLDGATGTELDRRGVNIDVPLWSARAILDAPQELEAVHRDYLEAGAQIITANTFRTHERSLAKVSRNTCARAMTTRAVEIAQTARDATNPDAIILGSVAPLEDCYRPEQSPDYDTCRQEHGQMIDNLLAAGVDGILIETMITVREAVAAAQCAAERAPGRWIASCCLANERGPGTLLSGEPFQDFLDLIDDHLDTCTAIGVNCVAAPRMNAHIAYLRSIVPRQNRICVYANIGYARDDGSWVNTDAIEPQRYADYAQQWIESGATIIGGCCGTTPATMRTLHDRLTTRCFDRRE